MKVPLSKCQGRLTINHPAQQQLMKGTTRRIHGRSTTIDHAIASDIMHLPIFETIIFNFLTLEAPPSMSIRIQLLWLVECLGSVSGVALFRFTAIMIGGGRFAQLVLLSLTLEHFPDLTLLAIDNLITAVDALSARRIARASSSCRSLLPRIAVSTRPYKRHSCRETRHF